MPDSDLGEVVCAYIKPAQGVSITHEEIVAHLNRVEASRGLYPARIEVVQEMPLPIKWLSGFIPTTPFFSGFIKLSVMGGGWLSVKGYVLHLIILTVVSFVAMMWRWRYLEANQTV